MGGVPLEFGETHHAKFQINQRSYDKTSRNS